MQIEIWLPAMFLLGVLSMSACFLFMKACENISIGTKMIFLTAVIALLLFIYLFVALVRPEWF
jgi:K+-transporting ATPase KdpF subunit